MSKEEFNALPIEQRISLISAQEARRRMNALQLELVGWLRVTLVFVEAAGYVIGMFLAVHVLVAILRWAGY